MNRIQQVVLRSIGLGTTRRNPNRNRPSEILINATGACTGGSLSYALQLLGAANDDERNSGVTVLANKENAAAITDVWTGQLTAIPFSNTILRVLYEQIVLPVRFRKHRIVGLFNFAPILFARHRSTVVVHNPNYFGRGSDFNRKPSLRFRIERAMCRSAVRHCDATVAISQSIRSEILREIPDADPAVAQSGMAEVAIPEVPAADIRPRQRFFLSLANGYPHKHLDRLAEEWVTSRTSADLVFVGDVPSELKQRIRTIAGRADGQICSFTGPIRERSTVAWFLQNCVALVSTSQLEAHPLTPAEGGAFGRPLLLSDIPPHREIAGSNAHYFAVDGKGELAHLLRSVDSGEIKPHAWRWPVTWAETQRAILMPQVTEAR